MTDHTFYQIIASLWVLTCITGFLYGEYQTAKLNKQRLDYLKLNQDRVRYLR